MAPKRAPDQVIVHRIELQSHERELLDTMVYADAANKTIIPVLELIVSIAKSPFAVLTIATWLATIIEREADNIDQQIIDNPDSVPTPSLVWGWLWNATGPGIAADVAQGGVQGAFTERVAYAREAAGRLRNWVNEYAWFDPTRNDLV
jgi:hypothetical protein